MLVPNVNDTVELGDHVRLMFYTNAGVATAILVFVVAGETYGAVKKKKAGRPVSPPAALVCLCRISGPAAHPAHSGAGQTRPVRGGLIRCFSVEAAAEQALRAPGAQLRWVPSDVLPLQ